MNHPGLLSWANSIRLTMASDPGRQVFKDQVQTHGFLFLDDYLDNIISGGNHDPLIDLVKTPGRKKAIARKPKLMSSKLANTVSLTLGETSDIENLAPVGDFKTALEKVSKLTVETHPWKQEKMQPVPAPLVANQSTRNPLAPIQIPDNDIPVALAAQPVTLVSPPVEQQFLELTPHPSINDLSIIAEDDEYIERSRVSTSIQRKVVSLPDPEAREHEALPLPDPEVPPESNPLPRLSELAQNVTQDELNTTPSSSANTFHSISLNTSGDQQSQGLPLQSEKASSESDRPEVPLIEDALTDRLPPPSLSETQDCAMEEVQDIASPSDQKSNDRPSVPVPSFPTLPEPMPLRKSMRPLRDPSLNTVMLGSATPGAALGGKRTSWLMKAREVKALEAPTKKPHISPFDLNIGDNFSLPQGTKRKSGDIFTSNAPMEDDERQPKAIKTAEGTSAPRNSKDMQPEKKLEKELAVSMPITSPTPGDISQEGVLDRLKKTVEGFGARVSKTMGKSLGGGAVTALAEARAAAEARVAERDRKEEEMTMAMGVPPAAKASRLDVVPDTDRVVSSAPPNDGRMSISDLFPAEGRVKEKHKVHEKPFQFTPSFTPTKNKQVNEPSTTRASTSTTPPHSPPQTNAKPLSHVTVFNKPPPVFIPPSLAPAPNKTPASIDKHSSVFNAPSGVNSSKPSPFSPKAKVGLPLTTHSTFESVQSDDIFDCDTIPAWVPDTQDTEYTSYDIQSQPRNTEICDEDDSWPVDEKLAAGVQWTFGGSKDDSMTWSTLPSQSTRDTGPVTKASPICEEASQMEIAQSSHQIPGAFDVDMDCDDEELPRERLDAELESSILAPSKPIVSVAEPKTTIRSQSQISMASSESSQSHGGFLGQASKMLSNALGTNKKKPSEVKKVLQMAAVAAKKQQEEADKKAARLKDMESRRQQALQRKAEEEKSKTLEEERKMKEEAERRKREREDLTDKRALKPSGKKEEESQKKRKIDNEKKQEIKKPGPSVLMGKAHLKTALKQPSTSNLNVFGASSSTTTAESSTSTFKGKAPATQQPIHEDEVSHPSLLVQSQMAARAKAQIDAAKHAEPVVPSENIELPDINSEYSDSEDEDRVRTFDPPEWAQSPELRQALEMQSTINPDDIFGAVRPLKMEEIFKTRTSRFRARSSSANWTGTDRLTMQEEKDYARRMGFK